MAHILNCMCCRNFWIQPQYSPDLAPFTHELIYKDNRYQNNEQRYIQRLIDFLKSVVSGKGKFSLLVANKLNWHLLRHAQSFGRNAEDNIALLLWIDFLYPVIKKVITKPFDSHLSSTLKILRMPLHPHLAWWNEVSHIIIEGWMTTPQRVVW